jgi:glycosyltransferase involved in cell wall biosynthesis
VDGWVSAIDRVVTDAQWAAELGRAGLERARTFTWQGTAIRLRDAYIDAIARRGQR